MQWVPSTGLWPCLQRPGAELTFSPLVAILRIVTVPEIPIQPLPSVRSDSDSEGRRGRKRGRVALLQSGRRCGAQG